MVNIIKWMQAANLMCDYEKKQTRKNLEEKSKEKIVNFDKLVEVMDKVADEHEKFVTRQWLKRAILRN